MAKKTIPLAISQKIGSCDSASDMILAAHSNASYLNEPKARSRAGGHFFLSKDVENPPNNGAILNIAQIIKMS